MRRRILSDLLMVAALLAALAALGCAHNQPAEQPAEPGVPPAAAGERLCPEPIYLPPPVLPSWPPAPGPDATEDQLREWYARCAATLDARERILVEDGLTCREALASYGTRP